MSRKQKKNLIRIIISALLLGVVYLVPDLYLFSLLGIQISLKPLLFLIPYALSGWDVLWKALRNIFHGQIFDENFLMSVATVGALCVGEYPEAVFVMLFYQVGELFQSCAVGKSRKSIASLMDIRPDYANLEENGEISRVSPEEVAVGEIIVVKPGEKIPLDGVVTQGSSMVNTSALTGESVPVSIKTGDKVVSGSVNESGVLRVKVLTPFGQSTVSKILELVENSASKKAKAENFITKFAKYYTPCVVICALLLAVIPPLISGGNWSEWISRGLIFLVISCPCALVISVPMSFFGGIGGASKCGILVKGGNYLEALAKAKTVVFDKTGTLTRGVFSVTALHPDQCSEQQLLEYGAFAEAYSTHPIAQSVRNAYKGKIDPSGVKNVCEIAGKGVTAEVDGRKIAAGNSGLMDMQGVSWRPCHKTGTTVHISVDGVYAGHIIISDEIKSGAKQAITSLKNVGVEKTVMLTGDSETVGKAVGKELGIDEIRTQLLPADKVACVETLLKQKPENSTLVFVGDGINDAPVLTRADVGIAMGAMGSDAAIEAADIVLMDDNPLKITTAVKIAKHTVKIVRENVIFALGVKALILALGALGLANMWLAVFADVGVSVLAIINAMRVLSTKKYI
ncbi:cadmium-translocating P-type ATPase [bacterium]|nr:cadmium-translocating P-type ATPase [bacterium]MDY3861885.1 heavy metal translocating P-type ATPase [Ruminococcus sp.]